MAETGASVLLIDSDLRKPVQHTMLLLENKKGLSTLLAGMSDDITDIINKDVYPNLDVLTSGSIPPNPAELIQSARMDKLLENVGDQYDYVFIDTPPVNVVTDALLYSGRVSGIMFVVKEDHTTHAEINEALKKASMTGAKILGFLKVGCSAGEKTGTGYKYKYKYSNYRYKEYSSAKSGSGSSK